MTSAEHEPESRELNQRNSLFTKSVLEEDIANLTIRLQTTKLTDANRGLADGHQRHPNDKQPERAINSNSRPANHRTHHRVNIDNLPVDELRNTLFQQAPTTNHCEIPLPLDEANLLYSVDLDDENLHEHTVAQFFKDLEARNQEAEPPVQTPILTHPSIPPNFEPSNAGQFPQIFPTATNINIQPWLIHVPSHPPGNMQPMPPPIQYASVAPHTCPVGELGSPLQPPSMPPPGVAYATACYSDMPATLGQYVTLPTAAQLQPAPVVSGACNTTPTPHKPKLSRPKPTKNQEVLVNDPPASHAVRNKLKETISRRKLENERAAMEASSKKETVHVDRETEAEVLCIKTNDIYSKNKYNETILHEFAKQGDDVSVYPFVARFKRENTLRAIINTVSKHGETVLSLFVAQRNADIVYFLIEEGADPGITFSKKLPPNHKSEIRDAETLFTRVCKEIVKNGDPRDLKMLDTLLQATQKYCSHDSFMQLIRIPDKEFNDLPINILKKKFEGGGINNDKRQVIYEAYKKLHYYLLLPENRN